jgi:hypothetical protein
MLPPGHGPHGVGQIGVSTLLQVDGEYTVLDLRSVDAGQVRGIRENLRHDCTLRFGVAGQLDFDQRQPTRRLDRHQVGATGTNPHVAADDNQVRRASQRQDVQGLLDHACNCASAAKPIGASSFPARPVVVPDRRHIYSRSL